MTVTTDVAPKPLSVLAGLEIRRMLRNPVLWIALALTVLIQAGTTSDWSSGSYEETSVSMLPLCIGALVAGNRVAARARRVTLAEAAPVDRQARTLAVLATLIVPLVMGIAVAVGVAVVSRIEGGFWIGEGAYRTDTALHPAIELVQLPLLVALCGVVGVACGGRARGGGLIGLAVLGVLAFFTFALWWAINTPPMHVVAPVQIMPIQVDLGYILDSDVDPSWLIEYPGEYDPTYRRQLIHTPTIGGHHLYLVGLITLFAGVAIGGVLGRRLLAGGAGAAVAGVVIQLLVAPSNLI